MYPPGLLVSMHTAITLGYREIVCILLERGQDVNFINDFGLFTLLCYDI
nr:ankyrin repeat containing protein [Oriental turtle dovepox virus]